MFRYLTKQARESHQKDPEAFRERAARLTIGVSVTILLIVTLANLVPVFTVSPFDLTWFEWVV